MFDHSFLPKCSIDYPLEIAPEEIASLAHPVNTLLRSSYLIGGSFSFEETFNSFFDVAAEIAGAEVCGILLPGENAVGTWELKVGRRISVSGRQEILEELAAPAVIASRFGKAISVEADAGPWASPICEAWGSRHLLAFPLHRDRDIAGTLVFGRKEVPFTGVHAKLLCALAMQAENHLYRHEPVRGLSVYSFIDPLTHLYNRHYFDNQLEREILRARRSGSTFSLLLFDLDHFTEYNIRFHNSSGDIALQEFADVLRGCMREVDTLARYGGDDFAVVMLDSDASGAHSLASRAIERFHKHLVPGFKDARTERLSVSVGIASFPSDSFDFNDLVDKAERALAAARGQGGGRVCTFHESVLPSTGQRPAAELPIRKIYDAGRSVVDMDRFLEILLFTGMQGISASRGSIVVRASEGSDFTLRAAIGFSRSEEHLAGSAVFSPGPITSWVVDHQLPLVVARTEDSPVGEPHRKNGYQTESFLSIPLTHMGNTLGALHLTNKRDDQAFTREDLHALYPIATEIASILTQGMTFRENVRNFSLTILSSLKDALEMRYPFLSGHSARVRDLCLRTGSRLGLSKEELDVLDRASILHDVGIIGVPSNILSKKRALNDREVEMVRKHPFLGAKLLEGVPGMDAIRRAIMEHHENFDGSGYPNGLRGSDICISARILGVVEYFDSITSDRPYRGSLKPEEALKLVRNGGNTLFDQEVALAFEAAAPFPDPTTASAN
ncbi:MAG: HD domain-containing phosphohydrolase [Thermodesulfobacteriota bacterium]